MSDALNIIIPDWDVPKHVRAISTTRLGGVSKMPFESLNLAHHVGDETLSVFSNREILIRDWLIPSEPYWLNQTHSTDVIEITDKSSNREADASWTSLADIVPVVMTADCLPLLVYQSEPECVAAIHAGWRGLCDGIIENTIESMGGRSASIKVWLGPAIGPTAFEVGPEVRERFLLMDPDCHGCFYDSVNNGKYMADIYHLAKRRLQNLGITDISGGNYCTYNDKPHFYSYRRDGKTGRMASLIWLSE